MLSTHTQIMKIENQIDEVKTKEEQENEIT